MVKLECKACKAVFESEREEDINAFKEKHKNCKAEKKK